VDSSPRTGGGDEWNQVGRNSQPCRISKPRAPCAHGSQLGSHQWRADEFWFRRGGFKPEYEAYGFEFVEKASIRLAQMKEALQLILWLNIPLTFRGKFSFENNKPR